MWLPHSNENRLPVEEEKSVIFLSILVSLYVILPLSFPYLSGYKLTSLSYHLWVKLRSNQGEYIFFGMKPFRLVVW